MDRVFEGMTILVTGSANGIGRGIATKLTAAGAQVFALNKDKEALDDLVKAIPSIAVIRQDLKEWGQTRDAVSVIDKIDGLVNCAAVLKHGTAAVDVKKEDIDYVLDVTRKAAINLMQVVGTKMIMNGKEGSIVNASSVGGMYAYKNLMAYCVPKAGLNMATKVFALELAPKKIRVITVAQTAVKTNMFYECLGDNDINSVIFKMPIGCLNEVENIVKAILFLLSDKSKMMTGAILTVDGGRTCYLPVLNIQSPKKEKSIF